MRSEHLGLAAGSAPGNLFDSAREDVRAAVGLVVAVHGSHYRITQAHFCHGFRHAKWLVFIRGADWLARRHGAKPANARADVTQNHEGCGALLPALAHVGAARALAHRVQVERAHDALQVLVALAPEKLNAKPFRRRYSAR